MSSNPEFTFELEPLTRGVLLTGDVNGTSIRVAAGSIDQGISAALQEAAEHWAAGDSARRGASLRVVRIVLAPEWIP